MQIWNKQTHESDDKDIIPEGWTNKQPRWGMYEIWDETLDDWVVSIDLRKLELISKCKEVATNVIYDVYPAYKQTNMLKETYEQSIIIAATLNKSIQDINAAIYPIKQSIKTIEKAKELRDNIYRHNLDKYVSSVPVDQQPPVLLAYRKVLSSMIADRLIKFVQDWCNDKISQINACITIEALDSISFNDCPTL